MSRKRIVVMGFMGSCPIAGVIWQHLHYIIGLQRLGHEVFYIEDSARLPYDPSTGDINNSYEYAATLLARLSHEHQFEGRWSFCARYLEGLPTVGLSRKKVQQLYRDADAILNVCGAQELHDDLLVSDRLIYIDSDPGLEQINVDHGERTTFEYLSHHAALFSFGENVGSADFPVPSHGLNWMPTRQPVVTDLWRTKTAAPATSVFTTIANWSTSGLKDFEWRGEKYLWSKSREFLRFAEAPRVAGETFEMAVNMNEPATRAQFEGLGWQLRNPAELSKDPGIYRDYIQNSKGEFTAAKDQYVRLKTGWFSDRSACYLAAGRPVITQDTSFTKLYGAEGGLFAFSSLPEITDAVRTINADYAHHSRAAAGLAQEVFEAETVLRSLLERAGI